MFKKSVVLLVLSLVLILNSSLGFAFAANNVEQSSESTIERISPEELYLHEDVMDFIEENGTEEYILDKEKSDDEIISLYGLEEEVSVEGVSEEELNRLEREYDLTRPETTIIESNQDIMVERDQFQALSAVWYLTYFQTNSGLSIVINGIGKSKVNVKGTLFNHRANGYDWVLNKQTNIDKTVSTNGVVYQWNVPKYYVADYFTYNLVASSDGDTFKFERNDRFYQRYNFVVGYYSSMKAIGGERHHFVSNNALKATGFNSNKAPAVVMKNLDHAKTKSWGNSAAAVAYRNQEVNLIKAKKYKELIAMEVKGFTDAEDVDGKYQNLKVKYYDALVQLTLMTEQYFGI